jgi:hypothetical protein
LNNQLISRAQLTKREGLSYKVAVETKRASILTEARFLLDKIFFE